ncbi:hypothetical protein [Pseudochryseolinea flava]|uniref:Tetratricopeptide repeat protein n=1 Tax=Pseudochryseolinea flava TaxID=2059302 RepID=A0A364Y6I4_9BACT|nr:hypothetical protein [Pseudochryseolinea flava]RAW01835.1 hypothetical protein DQQ10_09330 [Pseudochryseolinea flava]
MSTLYYLQFYREDDMLFDISKRLKKSLIEEHSLTRVLALVKDESKLENETVQVINAGVRGPHSNGYYCAFNFEDELAFWKSLLDRFPDNAILNIIYAQYLWQVDKNYDRAKAFYQRAFNIDFRSIGFIEPGWLDELTEDIFEFRIVHLRSQKEQYDAENFADVVAFLKRKYSDDPDKIAAIDRVNISMTEF